MVAVNWLKFSLSRTKQSWLDLWQRIFGRRLAPETSRVSGSRRAAKPDLFGAVFQAERGVPRARVYLIYKVYLFIRENSPIKPTRPTVKGGRIYGERWTDLW